MYWTLPFQRFRMPRGIVMLGVCCIACGVVLGGGRQNKSNPAEQEPTRKEVRLRGCLGKAPDPAPFMVDTDNGLVALTGQTAGLEKYSDREVELEGMEGEQVEVEGYNPMPSFKVEKLTQVVPIRKAELSAEFTKKTDWHKEKNETYGVEFAHPKSMGPSKITNPNLQPNFEDANGEAGMVSSLSIPSSAYPDSNLSVGMFNILVNRQIKNQASCMNFLELGSGETPPSRYVAGGVEYMKAESGEAAMSSWSMDYYFHTFQNGLCYEVAFELLEFNARVADNSCNVPLLEPEDNLALIQLLLESVSFFRPAAPNQK
jgi:hypothetical protein